MVEMTEAQEQGELDEILVRLCRHIRQQDGCWLWTGMLNGHGYGLISIAKGRRHGRKMFEAHRVAYQLMVGPVPEGLELDHLCRRRACVNPTHVEPVTHAINMERSRGFRTPKLRCPAGHRLVEANIYRRPDGFAECRECRVERGRGWWRERFWEGGLPNKAKTVCRRGHPFDHVDPDGGRVCRACDRINGAAYRARKKAA
jgi:hypothetical protein